VDITVIIYTHNRCQLLSNALENVARSRLPDSTEWEAIVIDNNSQDQTHEVAEDFVRRYPGRFRYLNEPQQGKSYALNAAIRAARGKVLAFTQDDVTVEGTWLQNLTQGMASSHWIGAGGRVVLQWPASLPTWF
jgi:glycosyltransferase involved in cell wall biosynthesis